MNPNYIHTITLYRKQGETWKKDIFHECFWKLKIVVTQDGTQAAVSNTYVARIPVQAAGKEFKVSVGDIVVYGECADVITGKTPDTASEVLHRNKPDAFRVTAFSDNTAYPVGKHYRMGG